VPSAGNGRIFPFWMSLLYHAVGGAGVLAGRGGGIHEFTAQKVGRLPWQEGSGGFVMQTAPRPQSASVVQESLVVRVMHTAVPLVVC
jgi:hypothetical protein